MIPSIGTKNRGLKSEYSGADGRIRYLAQSYFSSTTGYIKKSIDHGKTWTDVTAMGKRAWSFVCTDYSGSIIAAACWGSSTLYLSLNGGETVNYYTIHSGYANTNCIVMSSDGRYMFSSAYTDGEYRYGRKSSDFGATWTDTEGSGYVSSFCCSSDGRIVYQSGGLSTQSNSIYKSTDYGATWTTIRSTIAGRTTISCSEDGSIVVLLNQSVGGSIKSIDGGVNWTPIDVYGKGIDISYNGKIMIAASWRYLNNTYALEFSTDYGATWTQIANTPTRCEYVKINRQGNCFIAGLNSGTKIYQNIGDLKKITASPTISNTAYIPVAMNRSLTD